MCRAASRRWRILRRGGAILTEVVLAFTLWKPDAPILKSSYWFSVTRAPTTPPGSRSEPYLFGTNNLSNVRSCPITDKLLRCRECPLGAISGIMHCNMISAKRKAAAAVSPKFPRGLWPKLKYLYDFAALQ